MHAPRTLSRLLAPAALLLAAACDGGGGSDIDRLTPGEVQGVYQICSLRFTPEQTALPAADLLASVIHTTPPAGKPTPTLTLSAAGQYELVYTRRSDAFLQQLRGEVDEYRASSLILDLPTADESAITREALLPPNFSLAFTASPRRLTPISSGVVYSVRRADYARAAGITEAGLQDRISGSLSGTFAVGGCS